MKDLNIPEDVILCLCIWLSGRIGCVKMTGRYFGMDSRLRRPPKVLATRICNQSKEVTKVRLKLLYDTSRSQVTRFAQRLMRQFGFVNFAGWLSIWFLLWNDATCWDAPFPFAFALPGPLCRDLKMRCNFDKLTYPRLEFTDYEQRLFLALSLSLQEALLKWQTQGSANN